MEVGGIDGNGDGLDLDGTQEAVAVARSDISVSADGVFSSLDTLTSGLNTSVGVSSFGGDTVGLNVSESVVHKTTVASVVSVSGAVNQVLFR